MTEAPSTPRIPSVRKQPRMRSTPRSRPCRSCAHRTKTAGARQLPSGMRVGSRLVLLVVYVTTAVGTHRAMPPHRHCFQGCPVRGGSPPYGARRKRGLRGKVAGYGKGSGVTRFGPECQSADQVAGVTRPSGTSGGWSAWKRCTAMSVSAPNVPSSADHRR